MSITTRVATRYLTAFFDTQYEKMQKVGLKEYFVQLAKLTKEKKNLINLIEKKLKEDMAAARVQTKQALRSGRSKKEVLLEADKNLQEIKGKYLSGIRTIEKNAIRDFAALRNAYEDQYPGILGKIKSLERNTKIAKWFGIGAITALTGVIVSFLVASTLSSFAHSIFRSQVRQFAHEGKEEVVDEMMEMDKDLEKRLTTKTEERGAEIEGLKRLLDNLGISTKSP
jgi:hypothetical protein